MAHDKFRAKAPGIMRNIIRDLRVTPEDAAAILGNFGVETGGFTLRLEKGKTTKETTGLGWAQWTGSRRADFERWCAANGHPDPGKPATPEDQYDVACYRFFVHEITETWEKRAIPQLKNTPGLRAKTLAFMKLYERPGVPHEARRVEMAEIALEEFGEGTAPVPTPPPSVSLSSGVIPKGWLVPASMERIIVHWTAGGHKAGDVDREHYHVLIEGSGNVVRGDKTIKDNESSADGVYAAHTLGTNSGSIGVSMCAMMGAVENPFDPGPAPLTKVQWDKMVQVCAVLAAHYRIPVTPKTILTHAEVQTNLGKPQRGKWDVTRLAFDRSVVGAKACGDRMRREVGAVISGVQPKQAPTTEIGGAGTATVGAVVVGGGVAAAKSAGFDWGVIIPIAVIAIAGVVAAVFIARSRR